MNYVCVWRGGGDEEIHPNSNTCIKTHTHIYICWIHNIIDFQKAKDMWVRTDGKTIKSLGEVRGWQMDQDGYGILQK